MKRGWSGAKAKALPSPTAPQVEPQEPPPSSRKAVGAQGSAKGKLAPKPWPEPPSPDAPKLPKAPKKKSQGAKGRAKATKAKGSKAPVRVINYPERTRVVKNHPDGGRRLGVAHHSSARNFSSSRWRELELCVLHHWECRAALRDESRKLLTQRVLKYCEESSD